MHDNALIVLAIQMEWQEFQIEVAQTISLPLYIIHVLKLAIQVTIKNQRTNGPVNAHLISWPSKAQNIQNLENIW